MKEQLSWKQFSSMLELKDQHKILIRDILLDMEEWPDLKKRNTVLGTFRTFCKRVKK